MTIDDINSKYKEATKGIRSSFFNSENTEWYDYVLGLPVELQMVYMIVVLENQQFNGGLEQYFENGYGQFALDTVNYLKLIKANKKAKILESAYSLVNGENYEPAVFRKKLRSFEIDELFNAKYANKESFLKKLDELDKDFEQSDEYLISLLSKHLELC